MTATQASMKSSVIMRLIPTATSDMPKKLHRNPLISYTTGLNSVTVRHAGGSMSIE
jgi:hypothetical protein